MRATSFYSAAAAETLSPPAPSSPWHSPVPYLFGGLAAMLGLIAVALLLLACSYLNLEREVNGGDEEAEAAPTTFEEKILVIMAGDMKPTFLATPSGRFTLPMEEKIKETEN